MNRLAQLAAQRDWRDLWVLLALAPAAIFANRGVIHSNREPESITPARKDSARTSPTIIVSMCVEFAIEARTKIPAYRGRFVPGWAAH